MPPRWLSQMLAVLQGQQAVDLVAQVLVVAGLALVQDHQVDLQPAFAPVGMRLQQFLNDAQAFFSAMRTSRIG